MADGVSAIWTGLNEVYAAIDRVSTQADTAAKAIVTQGAAAVEAAIKSHFSGSHAKGQPHVGGSEPNVVTGTLRRSIRADPVAQVGAGEFGTKVGPRTVYARRVELGYRGTGGYPYTHPGYADAMPKLEAIRLEQARRFLTA